MDFGVQYHYDCKLSLYFKVSRTYQKGHLFWNRRKGNEFYYLAL